MLKRFYVKDGAINDNVEELLNEVGENDLEPAGVDMDVYNLFNGRHEMPVNAEAIMANDIDPMDFEKLEDAACLAMIHAKTKYIMIYVTGLTPAVVAVINAAKVFKKTLVLMHYNRETQSYIRQWVL